MEGSMGERKQDAEQPPSAMRQGRGGGKAGAQVGKAQANVRRGRPSYEEYARRVCEAIRADLVQLESCATLAQMPGVQATCRRQRRRLLPIGAAIRALYDQAVSDIEALAKASEDPSLQRIRVFLQIWYRERGTVTQVAAALKLSRSRVTHAVRPQALELVARRFLDLAWGTGIPA
jgi:hypothetical protein